jgi:hypothetical protein
MTGLAYRTSTAHIVEHERNGATRMNATARRMTLEVSAQSLWIIEGVYSWLARGRSSQGNGTHLVGFSLEPLPCRTARTRSTPRSNGSGHRGAFEVG